MSFDTTYNTSGTEELRLHDDTIQMLFAVSLKVEYCLEVIEESPEQARAGLEHVVSDLGDLIAGLREHIYDSK
jgi:signal transduction histidine kinase